MKGQVCSVDVGEAEGARDIVAELDVVLAGALERPLHGAPRGFDGTPARVDVLAIVLWPLVLLGVNLHIK